MCSNVAYSLWTQLGLRHHQQRQSCDAACCTQHCSSGAGGCELYRSKARLHGLCAPHSCAPSATINNTACATLQRPYPALQGLPLGAYVAAFAATSVAPAALEALTTLVTMRLAASAVEPRRY